MSKFFTEVLSKSQYVQPPQSSGLRRLPKPPSLEDLRGTSKAEPPTAPPAATAPPAVKRPIRCSIVQDGHSLTEQAIYQALWDAGRSLPDGDRIVAMSIPAISKRSGIHRRNVATILQRLIDKLAVCVEADERCREGSPRVYRVRSYGRCLDLRSRAGLEWVIRGRLVTFVDPKTGAELPIASPAATAPPAAKFPDNFTAPPDATAGDPLMPQQGGPPAATAPPSLALVFKTEEPRQTTTTSDPGPLQDAIEKEAEAQRLYGFTLDEDAGRKIESFRLRVGADVEETAHLAVTKVRDLRNEGAKHPKGILLSKPEVWITPRDLQKLRDKRAADQAEQERTRQENAAMEKEMEARYGPNWAK